VFRASKLAVQIAQCPNHFDAHGARFDLSLFEHQRNGRLPYFPGDGRTVHEHSRASRGLNAGVRKGRVSGKDKLVPVIMRLHEHVVGPVVREAFVEVPGKVSNDVKCGLDV
jgi:hypothetical protein